MNWMLVETWMIMTILVMSQIGLKDILLETGGKVRLNFVHALVFHESRIPKQWNNLLKEIRTPPFSPPLLLPSFSSFFLSLCLPLFFLFLCSFSLPVLVFEIESCYVARLSLPSAGITGISPGLTEATIWKCSLASFDYSKTWEERNDST